MQLGLLDLCVKFKKKRQHFENVCKQLKKNSNICVLPHWLPIKQKTKYGLIL